VEPITARSDRFAKVRCSASSTAIAECRGDRRVHPELCVVQRPAERHGSFARSKSRSERSPGSRTSSTPGNVGDDFMTSQTSSTFCLKACTSANAAISNRHDGLARVAGGFRVDSVVDHVAANAAPFNVPASNRTSVPIHILSARRRDKKPSLARFGSVKVGLAGRSSSPPASSRCAAL